MAGHPEAASPPCGRYHLVSMTGTGGVRPAGRPSFVWSAGQIPRYQHGLVEHRINIVAVKSSFFALFL